MSRKSFYKQTAKVEATQTTTVLEIEKPAKFTKTEEVNRSIMGSGAKWGRWLLASSFLFLTLVVAGIVAVGLWYQHSFEQKAQVELKPLISELWRNRNTNVFDKKSYKTILLLGLDQSENQRETSLLADTLILTTISENGNIKMISLPRDLWIESLKTKINALYYYGQQTNPGDGISLVSSVVTELSGLPIDYYVVMNMDTVTSFIDALNGIDVPVENSFKDQLYPREIDLQSTDPAVLFETISFNSGIQHMNGDTALKYIRSRHSDDPIEGTDEGRERRQQILLSALKKQFFQPETVMNPEVMGSLYRAWKQAVKTNLSDLDLLLMAKQLRVKTVTIEPTMIPVQNETQSGLVFHPTNGPAKQWVYLPVDPSWREFKYWFNDQL